MGLTSAVIHYALGQHDYAPRLRMRPDASRRTLVARATKVATSLALANAPAQPLCSRKFKHDHVCAICDGCHGLTLAGFGKTSQVTWQVRARTRMIPGTNTMYYTTRLLVFLAVTGGLAAAIALLLSGELIAHVFA